MIFFIFEINFEFKKQRTLYKLNEFCPTFWTTLILAISKNIIDNRATSKLTKTISKSLLTLSVKAINCKAKQVKEKYLFNAVRTI